MKIALLNLPWYQKDKPHLWGVRAGSRWSHFQPIPKGELLPRYIPFPFFMAISATVASNRGHEVMLLDAVGEGILLEELESRVADFQPDVVFAETSTPSYSYDMKVLMELKEVLEVETVFVCAGSHSPDLAAETMKELSFPDFWLAGEYDTTLSMLCDALDKGSGLEEIAGVIPQGGVFQEFASCGDLDLLPEPLFEALPMANYSDPVCGLPSPGAQAWLSRGCPYHCSFCVWPQVIYGERRYRPRSIDKALDSVEYLIEKHHCESFYFDDDTANIGEERMRKLATAIIDRGLDRYPWAMMARGDCMSESMIGNLAGAGMYAVKYGVESISKNLTDACGKATNTEKLKSAIAFTKNAGIKMHLTFTFGLPGESIDSIRESVDFAIDTAPESVQFSVCTPFPGTLFYEECLEKGYLTTNNWSSFLGSGEEVVLETPTLSADELSFGLKEAQSRWNAFTESRMKKRRELLVSKLQNTIYDGAKSWCFYGEREFASFLFDRQELKEHFTEDDRDADVTVIASRHDEEKIYRRLVRNSQCDADSILRVFN